MIFVLFVVLVVALIFSDQWFSKICDMAETCNIVFMAYSSYSFMIFFTYDF